MVTAFAGVDYFSQGGSLVRKKEENTQVQGFFLVCGGEKEVFSTAHSKRILSKRLLSRPPQEKKKTQYGD
jgi:hypothetical protein